MACCRLNPGELDHVLTRTRFKCGIPDRIFADVHGIFFVAGRWRIHSRVATSAPSRGQRGLQGHQCQSEQMFQLGVVALQCSPARDATNGLHISARWLCEAPVVPTNGTNDCLSAIVLAQDHTQNQIGSAIPLRDGDIQRQNFAVAAWPEISHPPCETSTVPQAARRPAELHETSGLHPAYAVSVVSAPFVSPLGKIGSRPSSTACSFGGHQSLRIHEAAPTFTAASTLSRAGL